MLNRKLSFKIKVLFPILSIFLAYVLLISFVNYRELASSVQSKTNATLEIFTDNVLAQVDHLDLILDVTKQILSEKHIAIARTVADILDSMPDYMMTSEELQRIAEPLDIFELSVADANGMLTHGSIPSYVGFDYKSTEPTIIYMALADGSMTELSETPRRSVLEDDTSWLIHYSGVARKNGGFIQLGFNANVITRLQEEINIDKTIRDTRIGENGFGLILSEGIITSAPTEELSDRDVSSESWYATVSSGDGFAWIGIDGQQYYAGFKSSGGITVVGLVPEVDFYKERDQLLTEAAMLLFAAVVFMAAVVFIAMSMLLRPINQLVRGIGEIAGGNLDARIEGSYNSEFERIKDAVNSMAADLKSYMDGKLRAERQAHEMESELQQNQISIMLSQIQPHFLYNSLTAIGMLCELDPPKAKTAVFTFAHYLRGNMDSLVENRLIPLEKEMEHVRHYLWLEEMRFGNRLKVEYDIQTTGFSLPALTIQPIVENAVRYGLMKRSAGGTVSIRVREEESCWRISVEDDGPGFDPSAHKQDGRSHTGIENVRRRLQAMCGGALSVETAPGAGTAAIIDIPKENSNGPDAHEDQRSREE